METQIKEKGYYDGDANLTQDKLNEIKEESYRVEAMLK